MKEENKGVRSEVWYPQKHIYKYPLDEKYLEGGGDSRWLIKPEPFFRPSATSGIQNPPPADGEDDDWFNEFLTPPLHPQTPWDWAGEDEGEGEAEGEDQGLFPPTQNTSKSSEGLSKAKSQLKIQPSSIKLKGEPSKHHHKKKGKHEKKGKGKVKIDEKAKEKVKVEKKAEEKEELEVDVLYSKAEHEKASPEPETQNRKTICDPEEVKPIPLPDFQDPDYLARKIPAKFWKHSYDTSKFERDDEEHLEEGPERVRAEREELFFQGKSYGMPGKGENSWLPVRDLAYHIRRNKAFYRMDKSKMPNAIPIPIPTPVNTHLPKNFVSTPTATPTPLALDKRRKKDLLRFLRKQERMAQEIQGIPCQSQHSLVNYGFSKKKNGGVRLRRLSTKE